MVCAYAALTDCNIPPVEVGAGTARGKSVPARTSTGGITF